MSPYHICNGWVKDKDVVAEGGQGAIRLGDDLGLCVRVERGDRPGLCRCTRYEYTVALLVGTYLPRSLLNLFTRYNIYAEMQAFGFP